MKSLVYAAFFLIFYGCADIENSSENGTTETKTGVSSEDTVLTDHSNISPRHVDTLWRAIEPLDPIALMVETDLSKNSSLQHYLEYLQGEMKLIPNPVRAKYEGIDFGDYFHLTFVSENEQHLDFADGNNNFGQYELFDSETFDENKKYVGKTFDIYWGFKKSLFPCCEGGMDAVVAKVPSITKLILID